MLVLLLFSTLLDTKLSIANNNTSISFGYSLTNKRKTAIFDDFRLFWAFSGHFSLSSPK